MIKNILKVLSANGVVAIVGLCSSLLLPRILSIEDYALYQTFILYLSYIAIFHWGFPSGMSIKYAGKSFSKIDKAQYKAEMSVLFLTLMVGTLIATILFLISKNMMLLYMAVMIFCYCFLNSYSLLLQAWGKFNLYTILHIMISAVPLLLPLVVYFGFHIASGTISIFLYVLVYVITTIVFTTYYYSTTKRVRSKKLFSRQNWNTEKLGFFFMLGNYINMLFHTIDKQFVKWFCSTQEFSYYSFAITMQSTMTIFITAIAQPLFPYMASGRISSKHQYTEAKRFLLMIGSLSGLAYFACAFVVQNWITKYIHSLEIIKIYFAVFPAMAVINCLYFNLYKIRKMTRRYIIDLISMFILATVANAIVIKAGYGHSGVAFVTTLLNYIWLVYGSFVFRELKFYTRELAFLFLFIVIFVTIPACFSIVFGTAVYLIADFIICCICFPAEIKLIIARLKNKVMIFR